MKLRTISFNVSTLEKLRNYNYIRIVNKYLLKGTAFSLAGLMTFASSGCNREDTDALMYTRYENFRYVDDPTLSIPLEFRFYQNVYVREKITCDGKILVDALDTNKILYNNYEKIGTPEGFKYYSSRYNGVDNGPKNSDGLVRQIILKDGTKRLVDADDLDKILIQGYDQISEPFLLECYSAYYGGNDDREAFSSGMVMEITMKDGRRYLVDANDFSQVIVENYESFEIHNNELLVKYHDGTKKTFSQEDLKPRTLILK